MNRSVHRTVRPVPVLLLAVVALLVAVLAGSTGSHDPAHAESHQHDVASAGHALTAQQAAFHDQMRKLWEDHVTWTRLAIVTFADGSDGFAPTASRLLQNQVDIGDALKPFYGARAGDTLTALLHDHITIAVELLQAARNGDDEAFATARGRWYANSDAVSDHLSSLNPKAWPRPVVRAMMRTHLDQTLTEAADELGGDYPGSVAAYDAIHEHILEMADTLSAGIISQFPQHFRR